MLKKLTTDLPSYVLNYRSIKALSREVYPGTKLQIREKRRKFRYHLFLHYPYYEQLRSLFLSGPLREVALAVPRVYDKVHRPYVIRGANAAQRFDMLNSTYQFVHDAFSPRLIRAIFVDKNFILCRVPLPETLGGVTALLRYETKFEREGELTLGLCDDAGKYLYSTSFSLRSRDGKTEAVVGCIQGGSGVAKMKELTKALEGLRPQNLVIFLLRAFCQQFKIERVIGVGFQSQIYCESYKRTRMKFDYDGFWEELGGVQTEPDLFLIPVEQQRRPLSSIRSNKRASYQRRYALLDELGEQVRINLFGDEGSFFGRAATPAMTAVDADYSVDDQKQLKLFENAAIF